MMHLCILLYVYWTPLFVRLCLDLEELFFLSCFGLQLLLIYVCMCLIKRTVRQTYHVHKHILCNKNRILIKISESP